MAEAGTGGRRRDIGISAHMLQWRTPLVDAAAGIRAVVELPAQLLCEVGAVLAHGSTARLVLFKLLLLAGCFSIQQVQQHLTLLLAVSAGQVRRQTADAGAAEKGEGRQILC